SGVTTARAPAATRVATSTASQTSASNDARFGVSWPPRRRSTGGVRTDATTVGTPIKNTPCHASSSTNCESKAATPASAARARANARLAYHCGARKTKRESAARSPCVSVIPEPSTREELTLSFTGSFADRAEVCEQFLAFFCVSALGMRRHSVGVTRPRRGFGRGRPDERVGFVLDFDRDIGIAPVLARRHGAAAGGRHELHSETDPEHGDFESEIFVTPAAGVGIV